MIAFHTLYTAIAGTIGIVMACVALSDSIHIINARRFLKKQYNGLEDTILNHPDKSRTGYHVHILKAEKVLMQSTMRLLFHMLVIDATLLCILLILRPKGYQPIFDAIIIITIVLGVTAVIYDIMTRNRYHRTRNIFKKQEQ